MPATRRILFVDRDGTLIEEPADGRVDALDKVRLVPGVIPALLRIRAAGFELVVVSNQDGLGSAAFPTETFERVDVHVRDLFGSQGIEFAATFVCPHVATEACSCRKPAIGLVRDFIKGAGIDRQSSAMVGDRDTDLEFARNLGIAGFKLGAIEQHDDTRAVAAQEGTRNSSADPSTESAPRWTWSSIAHALVDRPRIATVHRRTRETDIRVSVDLDSEAEAEISSGLGFFDHMLEQLGKHGGFKLVVDCRGDLAVDEHHTVEDVALALGQALRQALGDKRGLQRYGFLLPMDEADAEVSLDLGGRPYFVFEGQFRRDRVGDLPTELVPHFFRSLAEALGAALHVRVRGENTHHMIEICFKGVARTLRQAFARSGDQLPTTKGVL
jgi:imidazoleglycerol-phosphate dehydratase/histidinol-phosphatase